MWYAAAKVSAGNAVGRDVGLLAGEVFPNGMWCQWRDLLPRYPCFQDLFIDLNGDGLPDLVSIDNSVTATASPIVGTPAPIATSVYAVGKDGHLVDFYWNTAGGQWEYYDITSSTVNGTAEPIVGTPAPIATSVYAVGKNDGHLLQFYWNTAGNGQWELYDITNSTVNGTAEPIVGTPVPIATSVYAVGKNDGHLLQFYWNTAGNGQWELYDITNSTVNGTAEPIVGTPAPIATSVYAVGKNDGHLLQFYWNTAGAGRWELYDITNSTVNGTAEPIVGTPAPIATSVYAVGKDGHLLQFYWNTAGAGRWELYDITNSTVNGTAEPIVGAPAPIGTSVYAVGKDGHLLQFYWNTAGNGEWELYDITNSTTIFPAGNPRISLNSGNGFHNRVEVHVAGAFGGPTPAFPPYWVKGQRVDPSILVADLNSDGKQDLIFVGGQNGNTHPFALLGNDLGFQTPFYLKDQDGNYLPLPDKRAPDAPPLAVLADINGDGLIDLVEVVNGKVHVYLRMENQPDVITRVVEGTKEDYTISWAPISNPDVHQRVVPTCSFPMICQNTGIWVVSDIASFDEEGGTRHHSYQYQDARFDALGRGWLGFAGRQETDSATGIVSATTFDNVTRKGSAYPFAELPKTESSTVTLDNGHVFSRLKIWSYQYTSTDRTPIYSVLPQQIIEEELESPISTGEAPQRLITTTYSKYDAFGNPQKGVSLCVRDHKML
jgi:ABC-type transporter MlaC component